MFSTWFRGQWHADITRQKTMSWAKKASLFALVDTRTENPEHFSCIMSWEKMNVAHDEKMCRWTQRACVCLLGVHPCVKVADRAPCRASRHRVNTPARHSVPALWGPLTGGPQCRMSNLRNANVPCHYLCIIHVDYKIDWCRMSNLRNENVMSLAFFPMSIVFMSHVDFKKRPCRPFEFKGQGPHSALRRKWGSL